ncbi:hypothetical protein NM208_g5624 [Fusarium decemcellulare]|uniref:Uncharacterized protein n=1 Tax=Fusarium decemcellulare TaxID=57161 RepID=A0ACC1SGK7_9HYPO|nr:hypothetical protein NM208_g5624 [Fusarium decemcellulare]
MDPFFTLPPEVRLMILVQLKTRTNISPLLSASPAMLAQYGASRKHIRRAFLKAEFAGTLLQDALGIVLFPNKHDTDINWSVVDCHIELWVSGRFADPFQQNHQRILERLDGLYDRLSTYIEDYITKATSVFPPRAYLGLPNPLSVRGELVFRNKSVGPRVIKLDYLSHLERKRLLGAFLKYEFMCKVYYHTRRDQINDDIYKHLVQVVDSKIQGLEREAFRCVHRYVWDLYGAVFAHCAEFWLPDIPQTQLTLYGATKTLSRAGLVFPDNVFFDPGVYYEDLDLPTKSKSVPWYLSLLGLDLITNLLLFPRDHRGRYRHLEQWLCDIPRRHLQSTPSNLVFGSLLIEEPILQGPDSKEWEQYPGVLQQLCHQEPTLHDVDIWDDEYPMLWTPRHLLVRVYRQRAWVFFDDSRYYSDQGIIPHFPSEELLSRHSRCLRSRYRAAGGVASLRRSQKWQDEYRDNFYPMEESTPEEKHPEFQHDDECSRPFYRPLKPYE